MNPHHATLSLVSRALIYLLLVSMAFPQVELLRAKNRVDKLAWKSAGLWAASILGYFHGSLRFSRGCNRAQCTRYWQWGQNPEDPTGLSAPCTGSGARTPRIMTHSCALSCCVFRVSWVLPGRCGRIPLSRSLDEDHTDLPSHPLSS